MTARASIDGRMSSAEFSLADTKEFFSLLLDTLIDFKVPAEIESGGSKFNFTLFVSRVLDSMEKEDAKTKIDNIASFIMSKFELAESDGIQFSLASRFASSGVILVSTAHAYVVSPPEVKKQALAHAERLIVSMLGVEAVHLLYEVYEIMTISAYDFEAVWRECVVRITKESRVIKFREPVEGDSAADRMNRRCFGGEINQKWKDTQALKVKQTIQDVLLSEPGAAPLCKLTLQYVENEMKNFIPITFMRRADYDRFIEEGEVKTFWDFQDGGEVQSTWHTKYSDVPERARAFTDMRLWGERGSDITYGVIVHKDMKDTIASLAGMYGGVAVEWDRKCLEHSTLTLNDSSHAPYAVPASEHLLVKALMALVLSKMADRSTINNDIVAMFSRSMLGYKADVNFIEVQIHRRMKDDDVVGVSYICD
jgi:hypothetical protein